MEETRLEPLTKKCLAPEQRCSLAAQSRERFRPRTIAPLRPSERGEVAIEAIVGDLRLAVARWRERRGSQSPQWDGTNHPGVQGSRCELAARQAPQLALIQRRRCGLTGEYDVKLWPSPDNHRPLSRKQLCSWLS